MDVRFTETELSELAATLTPMVAQELLRSIRIWGDASRLTFEDKDHVGLANTLFNLASGTVHLGKYVFFGHDVQVLTGTHDITKFDDARGKAVPASGRDIHIEQGAWIASRATVLGPCRIGKYAVIGVGSVVTGDVRAGWFYAGSPARPIKPVSDEYADRDGEVERRKGTAMKRLAAWLRRSRA